MYSWVVRVEACAAIWRAFFECAAVLEELKAFLDLPEGA
jgi:hypothetical protein